MRTKIKRAFLAVRDEQSVDRVIADPELNARFIEACRSEGLQAPATELNRRLLNMRKSSDLAGLKSRRTIVRNQDEYAFASEIAVRFLERRDKVSLDQVVCDPSLAAEFDRCASQIAPGFTPLEYRWAALRLRKTRKLRPENLGRALPAIDVRQSAVRELDVSHIPSSQGLYVFFDSSSTLYVGEAKNLHKRIKKHLEHSDNKGLARWLWEHGAGDLYIEYHILSDTTATRTRKAMEAELIRSRTPIFNVSGVLQAEEGR